MPKFEISANGKKYEITAPDQASAIAAFGQFNGGQSAPNPLDEFSQGMSNKLKTAFPKPAAPPPPVTAKNAVLSTMAGLGEVVPFAYELGDAISGGTGMLLGRDYNETVEGRRRARGEIIESAPIAHTAGEVGGTVATLAVGGATKAGAEALGLVGKLWPRIVKSGASSAELAGLHSLSDGKQGTEVLADMGTDALIGAGSPLLVKGVESGARAFGDNVIRPITTALNRDNEAIKRVSRAVGQDTATGGVMSATDEAAAAAGNVPVMNADRFGQATRTLARTAANISPEADAVLKRTVEDRFASQAPRAVSFVQKLMNGATDDIALHDTLRTAANRSNNAAYDAARKNPAARAIWNQPIRELMQSPTFRAAISDAEKRGADRAAVAGFKAVKNPFQFADDGSVTLRTMPDGSRALPSLDFWDQVKRNLDRMIDDVKPTVVGGGNRTAFNDLTAIKQKLVGALDGAVPEYRTARQGAAAFFGADDAIDAGRKAFNSPRQIPEIERAVAKMTPAEKDAFSVGFSSEIIDRIKASGDRQNVIQQVFGTPSMRERVRIALGPQKALELEAYVKAESIVDQLRGAVTGNSTTAKQLIAAGVLGGGAGFLSSGGNVQTGLTWAAIAGLGRRGMQAIGKRVDDQVMKKVAEMLVSQDPAQMTRAIHNATLSKQHMEALDAILKGLELSGRATALAATG
jgi:hypothetical protein